jgi:hypothetical protein
VLVQFPEVSAAAGLAYLVGSIGYFIGYSTGKPEKRMPYGGWLRVASQAVLCVTCARIGMKALPERHQLPSTNSK